MGSASSGFLQDCFRSIINYSHNAFLPFKHQNMPELEKKQASRPHAHANLNHGEIEATCNDPARN